MAHWTDPLKNSYDSDPVDLGAQHVYFPVYRDGVLWGIHAYHENMQSRPCGGWVPVNHDGETRHWTVEKLDPLTLSPSLLCSCGDHGFIREGRWEVA